MSEFNLMELLEYIPASDLNYSEWVNVGMALKTEGYSVDDWDQWSSHDHRYKRGECSRKWNSFRGEGFTGATITQMAKDRGWEPKGGNFVFD